MAQPATKDTSLQLANILELTVQGLRGAFPTGIKVKSAEITAFVPPEDFAILQATNPEIAQVQSAKGEESLDVSLGDEFRLTIFQIPDEALL